MEIRMFCKGSDRLARNMHFYLKYNLMLAACGLFPVSFFLLEQFKIFKFDALGIIFSAVIWLIVFTIAMTGRGGVAGLRFQMFAITTDGKLVHFWFKEMLREGKVVLKYTPIQKLTRKKEVIKIIKRKDEIIEDHNLEDYLYALCNKVEVQKKSDILFEVMENIKVVKDHKKYINLVYTIGTHNTVKKLRIYKNVINMVEISELIYSNFE